MENKQELDPDLQEILDIRHRAGLHSEWPKPEPEVPPPPTIRDKVRRKREELYFEDAIGLGWMTRAKYKFVGWIRKTLGTNDYDVLHAAMPLYEDLSHISSIPTCDAGVPKIKETGL